MHIRSLSTGILAACICLSTIVGGAHAGDDATVYGWVENTRITPWGVEVKAKLDTGALTSSLHATGIEEYEKDGETWVRFTTGVEDQRDETRQSRDFERPLYRTLTVRGAGGSDTRPVVLLKICMNDTIYEEQFSLRDRGEMTYPMLLGRRTIKHLGLVDVAETFLNEPACDEDSKIVAQSDDPSNDG